MTQSRLIGLQYLRGVAALGVVIYHAIERSGGDFRVGKAGVDLFFVLSGFLMWAITDEKSRPGPFIRDRLQRILPCYWIVTSVLLAGALGGLFPAMRLTVWHVVASYLLFPAISPSNGQLWPLLVPGWTLEYEIAFYLLFAATLFLPRKQQLGALTVLLCGLASLHAWVPEQSVMLRFVTNAHMLEFVAGLWLSEGWSRGLLQGRRTASALTFLALALLIAIPQVLSAATDVALYGLPAWLLVAAMLAIESEDGLLRDIPFGRALGDASYSIYLWHTLALSVTLKIAGHFHLPLPVAVLLHVTAGVVLGLIAYRVIERPILHFFRRPKYRHGAPVPGGV